MSLPVFEATRYVVPLREGGSLPAVVEMSGGELYVVKFRGAGQGAKALIAEVIVGGLARAMGLPVPDLAVVDLGEAFGRAEPDPKIQDILAGSRGLNLGMRYLPGALNFDERAAGDLVPTRLAEDLVWLDAWVTNPDRTHKNPNLMVLDDQVWAIDHGAALYAHHAWGRVDDARTRTPFPAIEAHVLLTRAEDVPSADVRNAAIMTREVIAGVLAQVPDSWLLDEIGGKEFESADTARQRYLDYLTRRLDEPRTFASEAAEARERVRSGPTQPLSSRR